MTPGGFRDRLSMIDEHGSRITLVPAEVRGFWKTRKNIVHAILMAVFLLLPWVKVNGQPLFLLNLPKREFILFGLRFWAHDAPLMFFILAAGVLSLALVTALFGRVWCGWACPQTVFIEGFIRRIERWTEGNHLARRSLAAAPWSLSKIRKKTTKWFLFSVFSLVLTHSFLAYFVGSDRLLAMISGSPRQNWDNFVFIFFVNAVLLFDLAWFREQFCLIVCPYGRFQSVLFDKETVTVQYDPIRGEPRKGSSVSAADGKRGDCVGCNRCVAVCPTGIDIRNGVQMECIGCTACIDACDEIMAKVKKPGGLIAYRSSSGRPPRWIRPRTALYSTLLVLLIAGLGLSLRGHAGVEVTLLRSLDTPYFDRVDTDGREWIVNSYRLHAHNETGSRVQLMMQSPDPEFRANFKLVVPDALLVLNDDEFRMIPFLIEVPKDWLRDHPQRKFRLQVQDQLIEVQFVSPGDL